MNIIVILVFVATFLPQYVLGAIDFRAADQQALTVLQGYYVQKTGIWQTTNWWNSASCLNALIDFSIYTKTTPYASIIENTYATNQVFNKEGIDDEGWWGLSWNNAYKLTGDKKFLTLSEAVFADMVKYWDTKCNGGVWWDRARTYKNAVTNELFFALASSLYLSTNNATYLDWAKRSWQWFEASTMINSQHLINDGINSNTCENNGQTTWTYNQGVVLGGLANLWIATKNDTLLVVANNIVTATFKNLIYPDGILREPCETSKNCNGDQSQFKGIFMRYLGYLYSASKSSSIAAIIESQATSIWNRDRIANGGYLGIYWEGPYDSHDASRQSSACEALNAALLL